jgi:MFS family permease
MFIKDMFFFHEHPRKINIWAGFVILSPYVGPLFTAFILSNPHATWPWPFWLLTLLTGLCLLAIIFFVEETYYNRRIPIEQRPARKSRIARLFGWEQWRTRAQRSSFKEAFMRPIIVVAKPTVFLSMMYYMFTFGLYLPRSPCHRAEETDSSSLGCRY